MLSVVVAVATVAFVLVAALWYRSRQAPVAPQEMAPAEPPRESSITDEILELVDEGVLIVDSSLTAVRANAAARSLLGTGRTLPPTLPADGLLSIARRVVVDHRPVEDLVEIRNPGRKTLQVHAHFLEEIGGALLLLRDISEDQRSQRIRRQFVMHASHELKTPIAGILLLAEAVNDAAGTDPERTRHFASSLLRESQRLNQLVADLLDLSRLEDPATIANSIADLSVVAKDELNELTPKAEGKSISLKTGIEEGVRVRGDSGQLALMIRNLLENAVRYTPAGGEIAVAVTVETGEAILRVSDTGVGIPLRDQARVFERFYRVDKGRSRDQGGTGLGLAIVKHVADLHGGHVSVSSQLSEGSTFTVILPLAEGEPQQRTQDGLSPREVV